MLYAIFTSIKIKSGTRNIQTNLKKLNQKNEIITPWHDQLLEKSKLKYPINCADLKWHPSLVPLQKSDQGSNGTNLECQAAKFWYCIRRLSRHFGVNNWIMHVIWAGSRKGRIERRWGERQRILSLPGPSHVFLPLTSCHISSAQKYVPPTPYFTTTLPFLSWASHHWTGLQGAKKPWPLEPRHSLLDHTEGLEGLSLLRAWDPGITYSKSLKSAQHLCLLLPRAHTLEDQVAFQCAYPKAWGRLGGCEAGFATHLATSPPGREPGIGKERAIWKTKEHSGWFSLQVGILELNIEEFEFWIPTWHGMSLWSYTCQQRRTGYFI